ncbi:MAG: metallophosphoesterase family protein [Thaumarchaeota archaeon]|nr:metallophosphoesterase family protein [Nitrososphaerota archaeon]
MLKVVPGEAALVFKDGDSCSLLISDLHLGLEKEMAAKGFRIPPYSMKMMDKVKAIAESNRADRIIVLGDVKHSIGKVEDIDWSVIPWFFDTLLDLFGSADVVPGNHDGGIKSLLPSRVKLHPSAGVVLGAEERVGVAHGHSWPSEEVVTSGKIVMGHSHFTYELRDRFGARTRESVWLFAKYDMMKLLRKAGHKDDSTGSGELIVMPPFNRLVGGHPINVPGGFDFGPVLSSGSVDISSSDMFLLDGTRV